MGWRSRRGRLRRCGICLLLVVSAGAGGCSAHRAAAPPDSVQPASVPESAERATAPPALEVNGVLESAERAAALPAPEFEKEVKAARSSFEATGTPRDRLHYALLLLGPEGRLRDESAALKLLQEYGEADGPSDGGLRPLARVLAGLLRRQWEAETRGRELAKKLGEERSRADGLKKQVDELRQIERILDERQRK